MRIASEAQPLPKLFSRPLLCLPAVPLTIAATAGVLLGTLPVRLLRRIPERIYRRILYSLVLASGIYMLIHGATWRGET